MTTEKPLKIERPIIPNRFCGGANDIRIISAPKKSQTRSMTIRDAIYGLAVGDALGVPYEFMGRNSFTVSRVMRDGGIHQQPVGTFSDDTSMTLATQDSIKKTEHIDANDMRQRFANWRRFGEYAIDRRVFDIGGTVARALEVGHGMTGEMDNGNGSLMRIIPLAFTDATDDEVREVSAITHGHQTSTDACVRYVHIARDLISGKDLKEVIREYEPEAFSKTRDEIGSSGYVLDTYNAAMWCLANTDTYEDAILKAVDLGGDTDTTAAVTGALAGIAYGYENIPKDWLDQLKGKDLIESVL